MRTIAKSTSIPLSQVKDEEDLRRQWISMMMSTHARLVMTGEVKVPTTLVFKVRIDRKRKIWRMHMMGE